MTHHIHRACILDTETTGLDPSKHACIEVACVSTTSHTPNRRPK